MLRLWLLVADSVNPGTAADNDRKQTARMSWQSAENNTANTTVRLAPRGRMKPFLFMWSFLLYLIRKFSRSEKLEYAVFCDHFKDDFLTNLLSVIVQPASFSRCFQVRLCLPRSPEEELGNCWLVPEYLQAKGSSCYPNNVVRALEE